mgnify:FL=1
MNKSESWHYKHMIDPRVYEKESIMPAYTWLTEPLDISKTEKKISVMRSLGVPYPEGYEKDAVKDLKEQAQEIYEAIIEQDPDIKKARPDMELIALIAYLERLGSDIHKGQEEETEEESTSAPEEPIEVTNPVSDADSSATTESDTLNTNE